MYLWVVISIVWNLLTIMLLVAFRYLNAIQTMCPHILRYLTTAVITNRRRRQAHHHQLLKDLVKVIQQVWDLSIQWVVVYGIIKSFNFEVCISLQHLFYVRVKYLLLLLGLSSGPFYSLKTVVICLWAPGYRLTLWCALGLLVGGAIQVSQLQLKLKIAA